MSDKKPYRPKRTKTLWFLNGTLVRKEHISRAQGVIFLWDINKQEKFMLGMAEWKKKRRRAYLVRGYCYAIKLA